MSTTKKNIDNSGAVWIYRPSLDLIVGCGAWSVPLLALAYFSSVANTLSWAVAFYLLALFFNYPHYMATIYRAYHTESDFRKYRIFTVHITFLIALTIVLSHVWIRALPWIFTIYLTASPWHYSGQNYGLMMMFARRAGCRPTENERHAIYGAFLLSYAILFLNFHTGISADPLFISLNVPAAFSTRAQVVLAGAFVACSLFGLSGLIRQTGLQAMIPSLTLFSTQCVWFLVPTLLSLTGKFAIPQSRYSTGILAVMHSAQYLWITSYYAKREAAGGEKKSWRPFAYFAVLVVGGIALFVPGPWLSTVVFHFDFTRSFLVFTALINIHHFFLDGAIWKLRDGRISALLINSRAQIAENTAQAGSKIVSAFRWLAGPSPAARRLRYGTAAGLLIWGGIDQAHYYFSLQKENLANLKFAARLAPYDTPLEMRLANQALAEGASFDSVTAWKYAVAANRADPAPREAYLRYLLQEKRFDEAYQYSANWLKDDPRDAALLVNHGMIAKQLGHTDQAVTDWQKALSIDPSQSEADLLLAASFDQQGKVDDAVSHYKAYLAKVARLPKSNLPAPQTLIGVALKAADCSVRANHSDSALQFYQIARTLASETGEKKLESFTDVAEAALEAKLAKPATALPLYQNALRLDATLGDQHNEAVDWYLYASFLHDSGLSARLAYASLLKSEALEVLDSTSPADKAIAELRKQWEHQLGAEANAVSRNPENAWQEALVLKP